MDKISQRDSKREKLRKTINTFIVLDLFSCPLVECTKALATGLAQVIVDYRDITYVNTSAEIRKLIVMLSFLSKDENKIKTDYLWS